MEADPVILPILGAPRKLSSSRAKQNNRKLS